MKGIGWRLNPALPPNFIILKVTPCNDLRGLRKNGFNFDRFNGVAKLLGLNDLADQKVLLFGDGFDRGPLGQQQFFGVQWVHV